MIFFYFIGPDNLYNLSEVQNATLSAASLLRVRRAPQLENKVEGDS